MPVSSFPFLGLLPMEQAHDASEDYDPADNFEGVTRSEQNYNPSEEFDRVMRSEKGLGKKYAKDEYCN